MSDLGNQHDNGPHQDKIFDKPRCSLLSATGQKSYLMGLMHPKALWIVQELCESRGGRPELSVLTNLLVSVDVKIY